MNSLKNRDIYWIMDWIWYGLDLKWMDAYWMDIGGAGSNSPSVVTSVSTATG
jgi:hypothetical protein